MKTYENLRGKRADVRGRQVRANKILSLLPPLLPLDSLLFPSPPFRFLAASRFIRFCRASSRVGVHFRIYMFPMRARRGVRRKKQRRDVENSQAPRRPEVDRAPGTGVRAGGLLGIESRGGGSRGSFAFQLADSCPEETLIG